MSEFHPFVFFKTLVQAYEVYSSYLQNHHYVHDANKSYQLKM